MQEVKGENPGEVTALLFKRPQKLNLKQWV